MRVVYCVAGTRHSGGMERVLANKVNWLAGHGHEVHVVTTDQCGEDPFFEMDGRVMFHDLAINYEENNGKSVFNKIIKYPGKQYRHKRELKKLLYSIKADVVVSMCCNEAPIVPTIRDGSRKVLEVHFSRFKRLQYGRRGLWRLVDEYLSCKDRGTAMKYDRFVVLTEEDRELWGADLRNICVIPNAHSFRLDTPVSCNEKVVLAVGRFTYQKGFERLIESWGLISSGFPEWKLRIIGGGEMMGVYASQIKSLGVENSVELVEATQDIKAEYRKASILAMTSRYEGLPMALLEAQGAGLPIVSFACKCGPRDVVTDGVDGFLVEEGDVKGFAKKLSVLMSNDAMRKEFGKEAYANSHNYTPDAVMQRWMTLFSELLG